MLGQNWDEDLDDKKSLELYCSTGWKWGELGKEKWETEHETVTDEWLEELKAEGCVIVTNNWIYDWLLCW